MPGRGKFEGFDAGEMEEDHERPEENETEEPHEPKEEMCVESSFLARHPRHGFEFQQNGVDTVDERTQQRKGVSPENQESGGGGVGHQV